MKEEIGRQVLRLAALLFAGGGLWMLIAWRRGRLDGRAAGLAYAMEIVVLAVIFAPAYLGGAWMAVTVAMLAAACTWELYAVLDRAAMKRYRVLGLVYPGFCLAHLLALSARADGFGEIVFCYGLVEVNDSIAYLAGRSIGGRKLWPEMSPNKTVAGSVIGLAATVALAPLFRFAVPALTVAQVLGGAALLAAGGQVGDLVASRFKRRAGVKDYGSLIPAHGGVLDVYDSLIFVSPLFYYYLALCRR
ncbi:MAG TPA: phosphatidate cytidylyltransferase [Vicinamibacteria bacterium]